MAKLAKDWKAFRKRFLFTQESLAETLGVSRRAVQYAESGRCLPQPETQRRFNELKAKHEREK